VPRLTAPVDDALEAVRQALRKDHSIGSCRAALQQVNALFTRAPDQKPPPLTDAARQLLAGPFNLSEDELAEVNSTSYTLLDNHHLETCFLFRDAGRFLDIESLTPLEKASAGFAWVCRQVRLQENGEPLNPPAYVLRRGSGTAAERALVFLALLEQLGLDGCMIFVPATPDGPVRPWIPGVLVDKEIFLFDTRLGLPLPGHDGHGFATLNQVHSDAASVFRPLTIDAKHQYDVTPEQAKGASVYLACSLSALAPRMKYLEAMLSAQGRVYLGVDPVGLMDRFKRATQAQASVKIWNWPGDPETPVRVLRSFLPPEGEGGTDTPHAVKLQVLRGYAAPQDTGVVPIYRKRFFEMELVPWYALPTPIRNLPAKIEPGYPLREIYGQIFVHFPLPPPPRDRQAQARGPGGLEGEADSSSNDLLQRFEYHLMGAGAQQARGSALYSSLAPGSPRDDVLRARFDEGTSKLVETQEQAKFQKSLLIQEPQWQEKLIAWCDQMRAAYAHKFRSERDKSAQDMEMAKRQIVALWQGERPPVQLDGSDNRLAVSRLPLWLRALLVAAAEPMGADATYQLALCKQEQAARSSLHADLQSKAVVAADTKARRDAWQAAADWWKTYLDEYPAGSAAVAARQLRAEALVALGDREAAAALLESATGPTTPLEETGRLYRARQIRQAKLTSR
jgi:hypothetical protein